MLSSTPCPATNRYTLWTLIHYTHTCTLPRHPSHTQRPRWAGSWGFYGLLNWLPSFFKDHYQVEVAELGGLTLLPFLVQGGVGAASGGSCGVQGSGSRAGLDCRAGLS